MRGVTVALAAGLALLAIAVGLTLLRSPMSVAYTNKPPGVAEELIASTEHSASYCQAHEVLPQGVSAIRVWLDAAAGPRVSLTASAGGHTLTSGERGSGWSGGSVTVPVKPLARAISGVKICVSFRLRDETIIVQGNATPAALAAHDGNQVLGGRMWIEYLRPGASSWASLISSIVRRMGFGRAEPGSWVALVVLALLATIAVLASSVVFGAPTFPRVAVLCALIACLNAVCWSLVTPAFQVPDEPDHFAYVKQLAETGRLPSSSSEQVSKEELAVLSALHYEKVRQRPQVHTIATPGEQQKLESVLASTVHEAGSPSAGVAASQPPLYYALEAIPYRAAGNVLDRLALMRLFSALLAGLTAWFTFLFLREALPGASWAWAVGGLSIALAPLLGFMSGAVNPDSLLFAVSAAVFYYLARAFRSGLSMRGAAAIGVATAIGSLTKLNFIGLAPGIFLALIVLAVRAARVSGRSAYGMLALAVAFAAGPAVLYATVNAVSNHPLLGLVSGASELQGSVLAEINYVWQLYLPRLPGTVNDFPGLFTARQIWFDQYIGLYGWLDTPFPGWLENLALIPAAAIALLCGRSLYQGRAVLRSRALELASYTVMSIGLMALIGAASYHAFPATDAEFGQVRYLLPLLALLGAILVLAARGAGRRWGPTVGALIVVLFLAHDVFSQLQVVARFYG